MSLLGFELLYQKGRHVWFFPSFFPKVRTYGGGHHPLQEGQVKLVAEAERR